MDATRELLVQTLEQVKAKRDEAWQVKGKKPYPGPPGGLVTAVMNLEEALRWYDEDAKQPKKGTK